MVVGLAAKLYHNLSWRFVSETFVTMPMYLTLVFATSYERVKPEFGMSQLDGKAVKLFTHHEI